MEGRARCRPSQPDDPFLGSHWPSRLHTRLSRHTLRRRFKTACRALGLQRLATLTIHHERHTFISHALAGNRKLAEVRDAAGHANVSITSAYLHVVVEDERVGELFSLPRLISELNWCPTEKNGKTFAIWHTSTL